MSWYTQMGDCRRRGSTDKKLLMPLKLAWKKEIGEYVWGSAVLGTNKVYIPGTDLLCFDIADGELLWKQEQVNAFGPVSPTLSEGQLYVPAPDGQILVNGEDGQVVRVLTPGSHEASPCVVGGRVIWAGADGALHAADTSSGDLHWVRDVVSDEPLRFSPSSDGESVFIADYRGVYAFNLDSGEPRWVWEHGAGLRQPIGSAAVLADKLVVAFKDIGVVALETVRGGEIWRFETEYGPHTAPCTEPDDQTLYIAAEELIAISADDGAEHWRSQRRGFKTSAPICVSNWILIGGGLDHAVYAFDRRSGEQMWGFETQDIVFSSPAFGHNRLVIGSHDGFVYCFEPA